jgi:hypothetical protein
MPGDQLAKVVCVYHLWFAAKWSIMAPAQSE